MNYLRILHSDGFKLENVNGEQLAFENKSCQAELVLFSTLPQPKLKFPSVQPDPTPSRIILSSPYTFIMVKVKHLRTLLMLIYLQLEITVNHKAIPGLLPTHEVTVSITI